MLITPIVMVGLVVVLQIADTIVASLAVAAPILLRIRATENKLLLLQIGIIATMMVTTITMMVTTEESSVHARAKIVPRLVSEFQMSDTDNPLHLVFSFSQED